MREILNHIKDKRYKLQAAAKRTLVPCSSRLQDTERLARVKKNFIKSSCIVMATLALSSSTQSTITSIQQAKDKAVLRAQFNKRQDEIINIWSYNLRADYFAEEDGALYTWDKRKGYIIEQLKESTPDIICFQEITPNMYQYLSTELNGYAHNLQKRYEDNDTSFAQAIFYNSERFQEIDSGKFYLSETPDKQSKGWGKDVRICGWVKLQDKQTNQQFYVFNTHYTVNNSQIQLDSSKLINERTRNLDAPVILVGDFNCNSSNPAYAETDQEYTDATDIAIDVIDYGCTYNHYTPIPTYADSPIDFIWLSETDGVCDFEVLKYERENDFTETHLFNYILGNKPYAPSDHYAISADILLKE